MKESKLIEMQNKIESLSRIVEFMLGEIDNTKTMTVGTYQVVREMPGYEHAINIVTEKSKIKTEDDKQTNVTETKSNSKKDTKDKVNSIQY
jgi:hypothetical protein